MSDQKQYFANLHHIEPGTWSVGGIGGKKMFAHGIGDIKVEMITMEKNKLESLKTLSMFPT